MDRASSRPSTTVKPDRSPGPADPGPPSKAERRKRSSAAKGSKGSKGSRTGLLAGLAVVAVVVGVFAIAQSGDDDDTTSEIDRKLLTVDFVTESIERAVEEEGPKAVSLQLTEYGLTVEYFDPNDRESRYFETNSYTDGYELRVETTHYENYQPVPFDLAVLSPARIVGAVEEALESAEDAYTFTLRASVDRESGEVSMVTSVSGEESVDITQAP